MHDDCHLQRGRVPLGVCSVEEFVQHTSNKEENKIVEKKTLFCLDFCCKCACEINIQLLEEDNSLNLDGMTGMAFDELGDGLSLGVR